MDSATRVMGRFKRAQEEDLGALADHFADAFVDEIAQLNLFDERRVSQALASNGLRAEDINSLAPGKTAGPSIRALGGLILRGLWQVLIRPFLVLGKFVRSSKFREDIRREFRKALRQEVRASRHMADVAARWARGGDIHPEEFKAARHQAVRILTKVVLVYFAAPAVTGLFAGGIWAAVSRLWFPAEEILVVLLDRPLRAVAHRLLSAQA
jgi:hypothetical protein